MGSNKKDPGSPKVKTNATEIHPFYPEKTEVMEPSGKKRKAFFGLEKRKKPLFCQAIGQKMFRTHHFFLVGG